MTSQEQKKRLTKSVKGGLRELASLIESGQCADFLGADEDESKEIAQRWADLQKAAEWIRSRIG